MYSVCSILPNHTKKLLFSTLPASWRLAFVQISPYTDFTDLTEREDAQAERKRFLSPKTLVLALLTSNQKPTSSVDYSFLIKFLSRKERKDIFKTSRTSSASLHLRVRFF